jgi:hypothetical protein
MAVAEDAARWHSNDGGTEATAGAAPRRWQPQRLGGSTSGVMARQRRRRDSMAVRRRCDGAAT